MTCGENIVIGGSFFLELFDGAVNDFVNVAIVILLLVEDFEHEFGPDSVRLADGSHAIHKIVVID